MIGKIFRVITAMLLASKAVGGMGVLDKGKEAHPGPTKKEVWEAVKSSLILMKLPDSTGKEISTTLSRVNHTVARYMSQHGTGAGEPKSIFPAVYKMLLGVMVPKEGVSSLEASADSIVSLCRFLVTYCSIFSFDPLEFFNTLYHNLNDKSSPIARKVVELQMTSLMLFGAVDEGRCDERFDEVKKLLFRYSYHLSSLFLSTSESIHWNPGGVRGVLTFVRESTCFSGEEKKKLLVKEFLESMHKGYARQGPKDHSRVQLMQGGSKPVTVMVNNFLIFNDLKIDYVLIVKTLNTWKADKLREALSDNKQVAVFYGEVVTALLALMRLDLRNHLNDGVSQYRQAVASMNVIKSVTELPSAFNENKDKHHIERLIVSFLNAGERMNGKVKAVRAFLTEFVNYAYLNYQHDRSLLVDDMDAIFQVMLLWDFPLPGFIAHYRTLSCDSVPCDTFRDGLLDALIEKSMDNARKTGDKSKHTIAFGHKLVFDAAMLDFDHRQGELPLSGWSVVPDPIKVRVLEYALGQLFLAKENPKIQQEGRFIRGINILVLMGFDYNGVVSAFAAFSNASGIGHSEKKTPLPEKNTPPRFFLPWPNKARSTATTLMVVIASFLFVRSMVLPPSLKTKKRRKPLNRKGISGPLNEKQTQSYNKGVSRTVSIINKRRIESQKAPFYKWVRVNNVETKKSNEKAIKKVCDIGEVDEIRNLLRAKITSQNDRLTMMSRGSRKKPSTREENKRIDSINEGIVEMKSRKRTLDSIALYYSGDQCNGSRVSSIHGDVFTKFQRIIAAVTHKGISSWLAELSGDDSHEAVTPNCQFLGENTVESPKEVKRPTFEAKATKLADKPKPNAKADTRAKAPKKPSTKSSNGTASHATHSTSAAATATGEAARPSQGSLLVAIRGELGLELSPGGLFEQAKKFQELGFKLMGEMGKTNTESPDWQYFKHRKSALNLQDHFDHPAYQLRLTHDRTKANKAHRAKVAHNEANKIPPPKSESNILNDEIVRFVLTQVNEIMTTLKDDLPEVFEKKKAILLYLMIAFREIARSTPMLVHTAAWEIIMGYVHMNKHVPDKKTLTSEYWDFFTTNNVNARVLDLTLEAINNNSTVDAIAPRCD